SDLRTRRTPVRLAFADHVNRFVARDRAPSSPEGAKMLTRTDTALGRPMILFQDIVEILHRSMSTVLLQNTGGFEFNDGWRVSGMLVGIDYPRRGMVLPAQGFGQKALSRCCVAFSREKEVDRRTGGVNSPVQVYPLAFDHGRTSRRPAKSRWSVLASSANVVPIPGRNVAPISRR